MTDSLPIAADEDPRESRTGLREALIEAALTMVKDEGIEGISVREVARRAGVSSGAPFRHFKDRNALLAAVAEDGFERLEASMARAIANGPEDVVEQLKLVGVTFATFAARHPAHYRVMHHPSLALAAYPGIAAHAARRREQLRSLVLAGQASGRIRNADTELVVLLCVSMVGGLARLFVDGGLECPVDLANQPYAEVEALARAMIDLAGIGLVTDDARAHYEKSIPVAIKGRAKRKKAPAKAPSSRRR